MPIIRRLIEHLLELREFSFLPHAHVRFRWPGQTELADLRADEPILRAHDLIHRADDLAAFRVDKMILRAFDHADLRADELIHGADDLVILRVDQLILRADDLSDLNADELIHGVDDLATLRVDELILRADDHAHLRADELIHGADDIATLRADELLLGAAEVADLRAAELIYRAGDLANLRMDELILRAYELVYRADDRAGFRMDELILRADEPIINAHARLVMANEKGLSIVLVLLLFYYDIIAARQLQRSPSPEMPQCLCYSIPSCYRGCAKMRCCASCSCGSTDNLLLRDEGKHHVANHEPLLQLAGLVILERQTQPRAPQLGDRGSLYAAVHSSSPLSQNGYLFGVKTARTEAMLGSWQFQDEASHCKLCGP